jgi:hypothetical protein
MQSKSDVIGFTSRFAALSEQFTANVITAAELLRVSFVAAERALERMQSDEPSSHDNR